ncbi:CU044_5270 family protein [Micromonospora sp. NPDC047548]|uniref:CU044_5270 family protein n=1 Tax=Micromonospora sp. NPDC047548 TaxID=3155624 RepID=UPI0033F83293
MNELDLLNVVRPAPPPAPEAEARGRTRLHRAIAGETTHDARPAMARAHRNRGWWRLGLGAALAGGLAAAVAVVAVVTLTPAGQSTPRDTRAVTATPADLLRNASLVAAVDDLTARDHQFVHVSYVRTATVSDGGSMRPLPPGDGPSASQSTANFVSWLVDSRQEMWESANGSGDGLLRLSYSAPRPLPGQNLPPAARQEPDMEFRIAACDPDMRAPSYTYLRGLPTEPKQLRALVDKEVRATSTPEDFADPVRRGETTWEMLTGLAHAPAAPAKLRAAVYALMAEQTDVRVVPEATDAAGRVGVAVARELPTYGTRMELVFDRTTYRYLGSRTVTVAANPRMGYPAGMVIESDALLKTEVVDELPPAGPHAQSADCGDNRPKGE